jgi:hypothetical protein
MSSLKNAANIQRIFVPANFFALFFQKKLFPLKKRIFRQYTDI